MLDDTKKPLVSVKDLKMHFPIYAGLLRRRVGEVKAVDGVSFDVVRGRNPWSCWRIRLWQIDVWACGFAPL